MPPQKLSELEKLVTFGLPIQNMLLAIHIHHNHRTEEIHVKFTEQ